ncbi:unnamed protein product [Pocillopora meandrina]|uniref:NACHT domain-containing protein n=1 Tax=Pocillopora meandrina TaxID=46732 RepID=A0AAU9WNY0_9CNID|nr:unnamed protein product [Pocillopora meandrina]
MRPASTMPGDDHSKHFRRELLNYHHLEGNIRIRPVIATGDKRPASIVLGDHYSKQFRGELINRHHHEGNIKLLNDKLAYDWSVGDITTESFPKVDMLLRLTCRDMKSANIEDAIEDQLLPTDVNKKDKETFFHFIRRYQSRILLVLDGLDELPKNLFKEFLPLIKGRVFPLTYLIITARHEAGMKVRRHCDALFEILGYTKEDADSYIKKYFSCHDKSRLAGKLIRAIDIDSQLRELTANALNTALLCLVFEDTGGRLPYNKTMLYCELVDCVLRRYCSKKEIPLDDKRPIEIYADQLNQLGKLALEALLKDQLAFTLGELKSQSNEFLELGFLSREASASKIKPKPTYAFIHKTFQEFFAAFHLALELVTADRDQTALLTQLSPVNKYWQVWKFLITIAAGKSDNTAIFVVSRLCTSFRNLKHRKRVKRWYRKQPSESSDSEDDSKDDSEGYSEDDSKDDSEGYSEDDSKGDPYAEEEDKSCRGVFSRLFTDYDDEVCEDIKHEYDWRLPSAETNEVSFLEETIDTIAQCEQRNNKLSSCQIKMASTLARCFPMDKVIVKRSYYLHTRDEIIVDISYNRATLDSQFPLVFSEYLKGNYKLKELVWDRDALQTSRFLTPLHLTTDQFITLLAPALQANHTVTHLNMREVGVGDVEAKALGKILQSNHTLTHLCLAVNEITPIGVEALADALRSNKILEDLNIGDNVIGDKGAEALGKVLQSNQTLTHLCLADNKITPIGVKALAEALKSNEILENLNIGNNDIGDEGAKALGKVLQSNHTLTHLYIAYNRITHIGVEALAEALRSNKILENLNIGNNYIGDKGAEAISQVLESNRTLRELNVDIRAHAFCPPHRQIGDQGVRAIAHALRYNSSLTHLSICGKTLSDLSFAALGEALQSNCSLTHLYLRGFETSLVRHHLIDGLSLETFSKALQSRGTQMTHLDLGNLSISSSCVIPLAKALSVNGTLKRLDLSNNEIDCPGAVTLAQALNTNQSLIQLRLGNNKIGDVGAKEFVEVLQCNKTLMFLGLMNNRMTKSGQDLFKVLSGRLESDSLYFCSSGLNWIRS